MRSSAYDGSSRCELTMRVLGFARSPWPIVFWEWHRRQLPYKGSGISDRTDFICPSGMIYNNGFLFDRLVSSPVCRVCIVVTLWTWTKSSDKFGFRYVIEMAHEEMVVGVSWKPSTRRTLAPLILKSLFVPLVHRTGEMDS